MRAYPEPGTIRATATCANCGEAIACEPGDRWAHLENGREVCGS